MASDYFSVHGHSQFSGMDGMNSIKQNVARIVELGQPGWALTDHGTMGGIVQGYKESQKQGLAFFPGCEFYLVRDVNDPDTKGTRYHIGLLALDAKGYQALTRLSTLSWKADRFYYKPLIDLSDLAFLSEEGYSDHIALTTGCWSSIVVQTLIAPLKHGGSIKNLPVRAVLEMLARWFPHTYVELQDHGVEWTDYGIKDADIVDALYDAAQHLGLPVVFGADSHYIHPAQQPTHDLMKDICYFGAGEDVHFNGGPYHLLAAHEVEARLSPNKMMAVEEGHSDLLDRHALRIPPLDKYEFQVPALFKNADQRLEAEAIQGLMRLGHWTDQTYEDRLFSELHVIKTMGMANYHLLVKTHITDYARDHGIIVNTRGSANGSLVCYALGITAVDPIKWHTTFERYLSLDRMKPPDIDVDVDFEGRHQIVDHLRSVFPTMTQIGTYQQIGFAKSKWGEPDDDLRGSIMVQYMAAHRKMDPAFDGKVKREHWDALEALAGNDAKGNPLTPCYRAMGTNAAGFIIPGQDYPVARWLPQARIISSDTTVTMFNKDDVETMGYLKIDVLGLKALQTLNGTLVAIGRQPNEWDWIPDDDKDACDLLRKGRTAGVFQYEGFTNRRGAMEMKVRSTLDAILGVALYRPALINGGQKDLYLSNRGRAKRNQTRLHPVFDLVVKDTAGVPVFQEQIMAMLQIIGMKFAEYNELMTAIKASNGFIAGAAETFNRLMPLFYDLCEEGGFTDADADDAWHAVIGFTEYGFNRAHSTAYGLMAYRAAYLKAHHPTEFMTNLLSVWVTDKDKTSEYTGEARRMGYSIVRPDVNDSGVGWHSEPGRPNCLRKGLAAVPGIGKPTAALIVAERDANGPYAAIQDFIDRLPARPVTGGANWKKRGELKGVCNILYGANAFRSVGNR